VFLNSGTAKLRTGAASGKQNHWEQVAGRMKPDQKEIYYLVGDNPRSVLRSPHLDYFQAQGTEVLLMTDPMDSFMLMGL